MAVISSNINLDELSLDDCKQIFLPEFVKQLDSLFMCGNLGDPVIAQDPIRSNGLSTQSKSQHMVKYEHKCWC